MKRVLIGVCAVCLATALAADPRVPEAGRPAAPFAAPADAAPLSSFGESAYAGRALRLLEDPRGDLQIRDLLKPELQAQLSPGRVDIPNYGLTSRAVWAKLSLYNDRDQPTLRMLELANARMWELDLYEVVNGEPNRIRRTGNSLPFSEREILAASFYFPLNFQAHETRTFYLRFRNTTTLQLPLILSAPAAYEQSRTFKAYAYGFYFGMLAALAIYNLAVFFVLRDRNHLYYALAVFCMAFFAGGFLGLNYQYLYPDWPAVNSEALPASGVLCLIFITVFTADFLNAKKNLPRLNRLFQLLNLAFAAALVFNFIGQVRLTALLGTLASFALAGAATYGAAYLWIRRKFQPARYYLLSWGVFFTAILVHGLMQFGFFTNGFLLNHGIMIGAAGAVALLSVGLAARIRQLDKEKNEIAAQLDLAREIQRSLLPRELPERADLRIAFLYEPMQQVGGDFVDYHIREDHCAMFMIADVTGHGVPAALLASMIKMALPVVYESMEDPALGLRKLHTAIRDKLSGQHLTASLCFIDLNSGVLRHASAGHLPPLILRGDGAIDALESESLLLHAAITPQSRNVQAQLAPGDKILLYTDGVIEAANAAGEAFGEDRLRRAAADQHRETPEIICREIRSAAFRFSGVGDRPQDDVTILAIEYCGARP